LVKGWGLRASLKTGVSTLDGVAQHGPWIGLVFF